MIAMTMTERERNRLILPSLVAGTAEKSIPHASQYGASSLVTVWQRRQRFAMVPTIIACKNGLHNQSVTLLDSPSIRLSEACVLVRMGRVELPWPFGRQILSLYNKVASIGALWRIKQLRVWN